MVAAREHIGQLASCFIHETKVVDRQMAVNTKLMKVPNLTMDEIKSLKLVEGLHLTL